MRPSECIRRGCILRPQQAFHKLLNGQDASCATAALTEGFIGFRVESSQEVWIVADSALKANMPWLFDSVVRQCPECYEGQVSGWNAAVHLNNEHRWSRERIGEWLDTQVPRYGVEAMVVEPELEEVLA